MFSDEFAVPDRTFTMQDRDKKWLAVVSGARGYKGEGAAVPTK